MKLEFEMVDISYIHQSYSFLNGTIPTSIFLFFGVAHFNSPVDSMAIHEHRS